MTPIAATPELPASQATAEEIEMLARSSGLKGPADAWTILRSAIATAIRDAAIAAATKQPPAESEELIEALIQRYGYRSYEMIPTGKVGADGWPESVPGPMQHNLKSHPLIERVIAILRGVSALAPDRASMPEPPDSVHQTEQVAASGAAGGGDEVAPCGCQLGTCESKKNVVCRMAQELREGGHQ